MSAAPRTDLGGRAPPTMDLNISYCLWAIMTAAVLLAGFSLIANLWIYVFNAIGSVYGWPVMYPEMNHARWLFASGLLSVLAGAAFALKLRVDTRCRAIITVRLPQRLTARTSGADPVLDKFQCRAQVEIDVYTGEMAEAIRQHPEGVANVLEKGLGIAIADQMTRYSKARIEETLKLSLGECFDLLDIAGVTLLNVRQERVIEEAATAKTEELPTLEQDLIRQDLGQTPPVRSDTVHAEGTPTAAAASVSKSEQIAPGPPVNDDTPGTPTATPPALAQ